MTTVVDRMFDPPGPVARRTIRLCSACVAALALGALALGVWAFAQRGGLAADKWVVFLDPRAISFLLQGLANTVAAAAVAGSIAFAAGLALCIVRVREVPVLSRVAAVYVELARSMPSLLILYFTILVLPLYGLRVPVFWQLVIALSVTNCALIAEILRAAVLSVPRGQREAALVLGHTELEALSGIVVPQALRAALPSLVAQMVYLVKSSAVGYVISYQELLQAGRIVGEFADNMLQSIIVVTLIYLAMNLATSQFAFFLGRRSSRRGLPRVAALARSV